MVLRLTSTTTMFEYVDSPQTVSGLTAQQLERLFLRPFRTSCRPLTMTNPLLVHQTFEWVHL